MKIQPREGATRVVKRFLWLPKTLPWGIGKDRQVTRWWEKAEIHQRLFLRTGRYGIRYLDWGNVAWADMVWATVEKLEAEKDWED